MLQWTGWEELPCLTSARIAPASLWMTTCGGYRRDTETATIGKKKRCNWWCAACGGQYEWKAPNRILVVQIRANADRANVFKAPAAPWGLCDNLVNALKLLANQQKDGDSPIQSIITGLHERSRRGIMDGLRRFTETDNHSAVNERDLRRGTKSVKVTKSQFSEAFPEAAIREGADELMLWAGEVGTQRAFINIEHIVFERWRPPLVDAEWHAFCQAIYKGVEGTERKNCDHYRELSQAAGAKKPSERKSKGKKPFGQ